MSPAGKGLTSWLSFVRSNCEVVTFPLVSWVRCGACLYRFLIFAIFLTLNGHSEFTLKTQWLNGLVQISGWGVVSLKLYGLINGDETVILRGLDRLHSMIKLLIQITSSNYCCLRFKNRKHLSVILRICIMNISVQFSFVTSFLNAHRQLTCGSGCLVVGLLL